jgi:hypothetical protein
MFLLLKDNPKLKMDMRKESMSYVFDYKISMGNNYFIIIFIKKVTILLFLQ